MADDVDVVLDPGHRLKRCVRQDGVSVSAQEPPEGLPGVLGPKVPQGHVDQ